MQRITTYIILAAVFFSGALLIYRTLTASNNLISVEAVVETAQVDSLYAHKGRTYYASTFVLQDREEKLGIYNGTENRSVDGLLEKIRPGGRYVFMMDPSVKTSGGVNLGVREIHGNHSVIYKEPVTGSVIAGLSLCLISLVGGLLMRRYYRQPKPKRLIPF